MKNYELQRKTVSTLSTFINKKPELVLEWNDDQSDAVGYLVINSLKNGVAGGGTRMHENIDIHEVTALAKTMETKFSIAGPSIGGAKSGIRIAPDHPDKDGILKRWFTAIRPMLKSYYGTASDLNTDNQKINTILNSLGLQHSQEAIINAVDSNQRKEVNVSIGERMSLLSFPVALDKEYNVKLSEFVTGYGVAEAVYHYFKEQGKNLSGKRVFIQGVGNVGAAATYCLNKYGANIVAVSDKDAAYVAPKELTEAQIIDLLTYRNIESTFLNSVSHQTLDKWLQNKPIDILIPAAGSNLLSREFIDMLINNGLEVIACGANNPFVEEELCYGECSQYVDRKVALIPDFIANSGMARAFHIIMKSKKTLSTEDVLRDISSMMRLALQQCFRYQSKNLLTAAAYQIAVQKDSIEK